MPIRRYKPTSAGRRFMSVSTFEEVTKSEPEKSLLAPLSKKGGRNANGRITTARCYGALVTLDPTGVVLVRPGAELTLGALFRSWGEPLSRTRLASFTAAAGTAVTVFVNGKPWPGAPAAVPLTRHAEIVLEVGPRVPPHSSYAFPPGT